MDDVVQILTLGLGGEVFAIDAGRIREILDHVPITEVPNARPFVAGLINVRGKVVPLADLRVRFGMERLDSTIDTRIVVVEVDLDGETTPVGVLADRVFEVTEITPAAVEETPRIGMRWRPDFIRGVGKRGDDFVIILDIDRVVGAPEQAEASLAAAE